MLLTVVLTIGFVGADRALMAGVVAPAPTQPGASLQHSYAALPPPKCGSQLGFAGYSVTLTSASYAMQAFAADAGLQASDVIAEFQPITSTAPALQSDAATQALGLARM